MTIANVQNSLKLVCIIFTITFLFASEKSYAGFDTIYFSTNGDTTATSMTQGDAIGFGCNCNPGATILWEIWYDINGNGLLDEGPEALLQSEHFTDGNLYSEGSSVADGSLFIGSFKLYPEVGNLLFRATDLATDSSLQMVIPVQAFLSPPNQFQGQLILPGVTPPNALLSGRYITAESESGDEGTALGVTDNSGNFSLVFDTDATGIDFYINAPDFDGFVSPGPLTATASGTVTNNDFAYSLAVDSVYGFVKDAGGFVIPYETDIAVQSMSGDKYTTTQNGRYVLYFTNADKGDWYLRHDSRNLPVALNPDGIEFSHDTLGSFQYDFTLIEPNAFINVEIQENGGNPVNNYLIYANSQLLGMSSEAVSDVGSNNTVQIPVSTLDPSGWTLQIATWDNDYPIPYGLTVEGGNYSYNISPGATVVFNLINGVSVSGTFTQDPGDSPIDWSFVNVGTGGGNTIVNPDGTYEIFTSSGVQDIFPYADGYLTNPQYINLNVTGTTTGQDFIINQAHSTVTGTLVNVPLPLDASWYYINAYTGSSPDDGYYVYAQVDSITGTYTMDLCDGAWIIQPPCCFPSFNQPDSVIVVIGEAPNDLTKTVDFTFTSTGSGCCVGIIGNVNNDGGEIIDISDLVYLIDFIFTGGPAPVCLEEANLNNDAGGTIDISDLVYLIDFVFTGGPAPANCPL